jgi:hypothetical protein
MNEFHHREAIIAQPMASINACALIIGQKHKNSMAGSEDRSGV